MEKYNNISVIDTLNKIRTPIFSFFSDLQLQYDISDYINDKNSIDSEDLERKETLYAAYEDRVEYIFSKLKEIDYNEYKKIVLLLYHDYCVSLLDTSYEDYSSELENFNEFRDNINNCDDLVQALDDNILYHNDILSGFMDYTKEGYFNKRKLLIDSSSYDTYLIKLFPLHILEKLYYTMKYTRDNLVCYLYQNKKDGYGIIIETLRSLFHSDFSNYNNLVSELVEIYYKNKLYKIYNNSLDDDLDLFYKIIDLDMKSVISSISNNLDYLEKIIDEFYKDTIDYSDSYKDKVNKLYSSSNLNVKKKIRGNLL